MVFLVQGFQMLPGKMGVNLGSGDIRMAQHGLNGPQVCPPLQKMGGKGMAERMGGDPLVDASCPGILPEDLPEPLAADLPASLPQEQISLEGRSRPARAFEVLP